MMEYNRRNELLGNGFRAEPALPSGKADCLTVGGKRSKDLVMQLNRSTESGGKQPYQQDRVYDIAGQSPALMAGAGCRTLINWSPIGRIRRLTPTECARLQTIPDWYRWECSETQQHRMLGNGWTVEVIKHIFSFIDVDKILKRKHLNTE